MPEAEKLRKLSPLDLFKIAEEAIRYGCYEYLDVNNFPGVDPYTVDTWKLEALDNRIKRIWTTQTIVAGNEKAQLGIASHILGLIKIAEDIGLKLPQEPEARKLFSTPWIEKSQIDAIYFFVDSGYPDFFDPDTNYLVKSLPEEIVETLRVKAQENKEALDLKKRNKKKISF